VDRPRIIQGRAIGPGDVARIRDWLQTHPGSNRTRLSRELCAAWNWRNGAGRLKDMACRSLLLKLEAQGDIRLPPRRTASVNGLRNRQALHLAHDPSSIEGPLSFVQPLRVQAVSAGSSEARLFQFLLQRYHYLGHRNCVGENLKYLALAQDGRPLACLLFGSAAWKCAARDRWIGWTAPQRRRHLGRVTARLSADWQQKYGHPIYLVESFVQEPRFAGLCYQAAGWVRVGVTTGRTRNDDGLKPGVAPKALYLKALRADAPRRLTG